MLNPNTLYNAVFKPEYRKFDPIKDYFTVLIDTPAFAPLYEEVRQRLESMMNSESYLYFHSEKPADIQQITMDEHMSDVVEYLDTNIEGAPPARRYCILSYFDDENKDLDGFLKMLGYLNREPKDIVTLMICISKRMNGVNAFLSELAEKLCEKGPSFDVYLFSDGHTSYYRRALVQSICGAVIMNADLASYRERTLRKRSACSTIDSFIDSQLSADGKSRLEKTPPLRWSTVYCKHYDRQYDFLNKYLSDICKNVRHLTAPDFFRMIEDLYTSLIPAKESKDVKAALKTAISNTPYIVKTPPKGSSRTLSDHFNQVYGYKGSATVELSLKATLSGIYSYRTEELIKKCCTQIFVKCSGFAEENLYEQICTYLAQYIETLNGSCVSLRSSLRLLLDDDVLSDQQSEAIGKYLEKYTQLYLKQKAEAFWIEALRHLQTYPEIYDSYCQKACEYHTQLQELIKSIPTGRVYQFEEVELKSFTAQEILTMDQSEELCAYVHEIFNGCKDSGQGIVHPDNCSPVFGIAVDPNFYRSTPVKLENASYTICGCEYNGQYLVYIGGEKDV